MYFAGKLVYLIVRASNQLAVRRASSKKLKNCASRYRTFTKVGGFGETKSFL